MVNNQIKFLGTITKVSFANDKVCKFDITTREPMSNKAYDITLTTFEPGIIQEIKSNEGKVRAYLFYGYAYKNNYKNKEGNWVNETTLCITQLSVISN